MSHTVLETKVSMSCQARAAARAACHELRHAESCRYRHNPAGISFVYGIGWYLLAAGPARRVQHVKLSDWQV